MCLNWLLGYIMHCWLVRNVGGLGNPLHAVHAQEIILIFIINNQQKKKKSSKVGNKGLEIKTLCRHPIYLGSQGERKGYFC